MSNIIGYAQVEKIRVLRVALLEAHRRAATTIKAGATWSQIEAEEEQATQSGGVHVPHLLRCWNRSSKQSVSAAL
jgi:hypothetical protein